ncbi:RNA 2',3'-cyclic phosphodiesterase, partial [Candidatus Woesearchaeota archaeon]|nr:RNA 2',3'-cyclic phosphodiesterase [Candidatus Woesearchaeota archaeon]
MRLFIAVELPDVLDRQISELKNNLDTDLAKMTLTKDNHLTLKFLGETDKVDEIKEALKNIEFSSYKAKLNSIGVFPNENYIRVVWVGVKPAEDTIELKKKIDEALKDFNFK